MKLGSGPWQNTLKNGAATHSLDLDGLSLEKFLVYAEELLTWNRKINLTAITEPDEITEKHFIDSLAAVPYINPCATALDIGAGAGFPGIPLKIVRPDLKMTLIDASVKKVSFLKHIIRLLDLKDTEAHHIRAEDMPRNTEPVRKFDIILCRAFSSLDNFLCLALPLLANGGKAVALKGNLPLQELQDIGGTDTNTQTLLWKGFSLELTIKTYHLPYTKGNRTLICFTLK